MSSRSRNRLVSALLLMLVTFGGAAGSSLALVRMAQVSAIVCPPDRRPSRPRRISISTAPQLPPPPVRLRIAWREPRPLDFFACHDLFQRPPPPAFFSRA